MKKLRFATVILLMPLAFVQAQTASSNEMASPKHVYSKCGVADNSIAITFDDGPHPEHTPKLLDMLKERNIRATFYVIGKNVIAYPEIIKRMVEEGHEIGNHTWNHPSLTKIGQDKVAAEINETSQAIEAVSGTAPATMRPPYGATNAALNKRHDEEFGLKVVLWSVDPMDWKYRDSERVSSQIIESAKPGDIILAHDIHKTTVAAMPKTLDALIEKGFTFVTVSELIAADTAKPLRRVREAASPDVQASGMGTIAKE